MTIRKEIDLNAPLTNEQKDMLEKLKTRHVQPDEECHEITPKQLDYSFRKSKYINDFAVERIEDECDLVVYEQAYKEYVDSGMRSAPIEELWNKLNI